MGFNYINYNELGLLVSKDVSPISKGNNYVDTFYFHFENRDFTNAHLTFTATLPDGNVLPSCATTPTSYDENGVRKNGYMMKLSNAYTSQAGTITFTLTLKDNNSNAILCSAQLTLTIADTDVKVPTTIQESEKDQILQAIADAVRDLDARKVEVDLSIYGEATEVAETNGNVAISSGGNTYQIPASKVINKVDSVNGYTGDVSLKSSDISHKESNVELVLDSKADAKEVCYYRDGEAIPSELKAKGFLSYSIEEDVYERTTTIKLDSENFENGDLVAFDVEYKSGSNYETQSYLRLLKGDFSEARYLPDVDGTGVRYVGITGSYGQNILVIKVSELNARLLNVAVFRW